MEARHRGTIIQASLIFISEFYTSTAIRSEASAYCLLRMRHGEAMAGPSFRTAFIQMFGLVYCASHNRTAALDWVQGNPAKRCASIRLEETLDGQGHALNQSDMPLEARG